MVIDRALYGIFQHHFFSFVANWPEFVKDTMVLGTDGRQATVMLTVMSKLFVLVCVRSGPCMGDENLFDCHLRCYCVSCWAWNIGDYQSLRNNGACNVCPSVWCCLIRVLRWQCQFLSGVVNLMVTFASCGVWNCVVLLAGVGNSVMTDILR